MKSFITITESKKKQIEEIINSTLPEPPKILKDLIGNILNDVTSKERIYDSLYLVDDLKTMIDYIISDWIQRYKLTYLDEKLFESDANEILIKILGKTDDSMANQISRIIVANIYSYILELYNYKDQLATEIAKILES